MPPETGVLFNGHMEPGQGPADRYPFVAAP